jgi:anti-sigma regulatory factor (Ser/Thr protein kinase)
MLAAPASVPLARHRVVDLLRTNGWDDRHVAEAALMTTELATNAVEHAHTPYTVAVQITDEMVRIDVHDGSTARPVVGAGDDASASGGRGLAFVAALSARWGCDVWGGGKSVWFEARRLPAT